MNSVVDLYMPDWAFTPRKGLLDPTGLAVSSFAQSLTRIVPPSYYFLLTPP
jgi:hypothetical protein